jgi:hypothetical protein
MGCSLIAKSDIDKERQDGGACDGGNWFDYVYTLKKQ